MDPSRLLLQLTPWLPSALSGPASLPGAKVECTSFDLGIVDGCWRSCREFSLLWSGFVSWEKKGFCSITLTIIFRNLNISLLGDFSHALE